MANRRIALSAALALAVCACGSGGADATSISSTTIVDCSWFDGPNCWTDAVAVADACANPLATGAFDPATTTCTYADGTKVEFDPSAPATASLNHDAPWNFTVRAPDGTACVSFVETAYSWTLETARGTVTWEFGPTATAVTCADGGRFTTDPASGTACLVGGYGPLTVGSTVNFPIPSGGGTVWRCE